MTRKAIIFIHFFILLISCQKNRIEIFTSINPPSLSIDGEKLNEISLSTDTIHKFQFKWRLPESDIPEIDLEGIQVEWKLVDKEGREIFHDLHFPYPQFSLWYAGQEIVYEREVFIKSVEFKKEGLIWVRISDPLKKSLVYHLGEKNDKAANLKENLDKMKGKLAKEFQKNGWYFLGEIKCEPPFLPPLPIAELDGWYPPEGEFKNSSIYGFRWTAGISSASFPNPLSDILVYMDAQTPQKLTNNPPIITLYIEGEKVAEFSAGWERFKKWFLVGKEKLGGREICELTIEVDQPFIPQKIGVGSDDRELGILFYDLIRIREFNK